MTAVWMRLRWELRSQWRSWLGLALVIGLGGGAAIAAATGARRTETAYPRFVQAQNGYDIYLGGFPDTIHPELALARVEAIPEVLQWARVDVAASEAILPSGRRASWPELLAITDLSGRFGSELNRFKAASGRLADSGAPDEAMIDFATADREGLHVGSLIRFITGDEHPQLANVRIVGFIATPGQFPAVGTTSAFTTSVYVTPAFVRANKIAPDPRSASLALRLRRGAADRDAFIQHLAAAGLGEADRTEQEVQTAAIQRSIRLESQALWALCVLISLGACAIVGQSLARQTHLESADFPTLSALGMSRVQLLTLGLVRAGIIGVVAACVAVPTAILLSPLTPIGLARIAEPHPGIRIDTAPLLLGVLTIALFTVLVTVLPAWLAARAVPSVYRGPAALRERPSAFATVLGRVFSSPPAMVGTRMALQPGRDRRAIPIRSAGFGATLSLAALTASLLFAASLAHVLDTPRLSGYTWDAYVAAAEDHGRQVAAAFGADPNVAAYEHGGFQNFTVGRASVEGLTFDGAGPIRPVVTAGTAPAAADEIALGAATMRATHSAIGSTVDVSTGPQGSPTKPIRVRVVGLAIVPSGPFGVTTLGEGAAVPLAAVHRMDPDVAAQPNDAPFLVRFAPGVNRDAGLAAVSTDGHGFVELVITSERQASVTSLARIADVPVLLAGALAVLAAGSFAHVLLSSTRRRRRDLAILKALGFVRPQLRRTIAWQATTLAAGALLIGLPIGVVGGRLAWRIFAEQLGVVPHPVLPVIALVATIPSTLALAMLISAVPGQAAARTKPDVVLRGE